MTYFDTDSNYSEQSETKMSQLSHSSLSLSNTSKGERLRRIRCRRWCFTWNNYPKDYMSQLSQYFGNASFVFQPEIGEKGTEHIQGYVEFKYQKDFNTLHKKFPDIHWEKCKNKKASIEYCSKKDTRCGEIIAKGIHIKEEIEDPLQGLEFYDWQKEIIKIINTKPDRRTIHWYWEEFGNSGKTTLAFHLCLKNEKYILVDGKANDVKCAVAQMVHEKKYPKLVMWDLSRTREDYVSYESIEKIKNGIFFSGKYESGMVQYNPPHVIVFANFPPDTSKLSKDRWHIVEIIL